MSVVSLAREKEGRILIAVGVQLPEVERKVSWSELRDMAVIAEESGLDSVWVGEHLLYRLQDGSVRGPWDCWTLLAGLAECTSEIQIGPLVSCLPFHNPAMLAKKAVAVDELSGGRLILGVGSGWNRREFEAFGFNYSERFGCFSESIKVLHDLLRGKTVTYQGNHIRLQDCVILPSGPRTEGLPIMFGGNGSRVTSAALPYLDGWNLWYTWFGNDIERYPAIAQQFDARCINAGRDPDTVDKSIALLVDMTGGRHKSKRLNSNVNPLSGDPESLSRTLIDVAAFGVSHVQLVLDPITTDSIDALSKTIHMLKSD